MTVAYPDIVRVKPTLTGFVLGYVSGLTRPTARRLWGPTRPSRLYSHSKAEASLPVDARLGDKVTVSVAGICTSLVNYAGRARPGHRASDLLDGRDISRFGKWGTHYYYLVFITSSLPAFPLPLPPFRQSRNPPPLTSHHRAHLAESTYPSIPHFANKLIFLTEMVSCKSVFKAIFRSQSELADDSFVTPSSSKSRRKTPSRAFTVPASPARPTTLSKPLLQAGPSTRNHLNPYSNNPNRHSAIALRDILSPRPRLRKNSLPSLLPDGPSTLPPREHPSPLSVTHDTNSQDQRQLSASPIQDSRESHDNYFHEPYLSPVSGPLDSFTGDPISFDHLDSSLVTSGVPESSNISLLLSPQPEDARKAMSKRLEGLAMALDMFQPIQTPSPPTPQRHLGFTSRGLTKLDTSLNVTRPLMTLPVSLKSAAIVGSTSLSPIENWRDEEADEQSSDDEMSEDFDDSLYFRIPGFKFSGSSHSSSSVSSSISDLPPTPVDPPTHPADAVQLLPPFLPKSPVAFNLGPVVQSRVDNCKATPTPVISVDTLDAQSGIVLL